MVDGTLSRTSGDEVIAWIVVVVMKTRAVCSEHRPDFVIAAFGAKRFENASHPSAACQLGPEVFGNLAVFVEFRQAERAPDD
jgi:hypothetical protein